MFINISALKKLRLFRRQQQNKLIIRLSSQEWLKMPVIALFPETLNNFNIILRQQTDDAGNRKLCFSDPIVIGINMVVKCFR